MESWSNAVATALRAVGYLSRGIVEFWQSGVPTCTCTLNFTYTSAGCTQALNTKAHYSITPSLHSAGYPTAHRALATAPLYHPVFPCFAAC
jgi:hypothetical protein